MSEAGGEAGLARELRDTFSPAVAVVCDDSVADMFAASGLSFVDVLRVCSQRAGVGSQGAAASPPPPSPARAASASSPTVERRHHLRLTAFERGV